MSNNPLKPHDYDGIQEYDNNLPQWWVWTFVMTVVFGLGYWLFYHVYQIGPGQIGELEADLKKHHQAAAALLPEEKPFGDSDVALLITDPQSMTEAKGVFATNCSPCHGPQGGGVIGPNLTDDYWIHGNKPNAIFRTIEVGVVDKGMVPWKGVLTAAQTRNLTAYILSLKGSNPANPKAPQGEKM